MQSHEFSEISVDMKLAETLHFFHISVLSGLSDHLRCRSPRANRSRCVWLSFSINSPCE